MRLARLQKEEAGLEREPIAGVLVARDGTWDFHFCLYDVEGDFAGGTYHGLLRLHENYPFHAPKLFFYTPNGRFETNTPICTSFTDYHQENWSSAWNVRSLILATISFMHASEPSFGCRKDPVNVRRALAAGSMGHNLKSPEFVRMFREGLERAGKLAPVAEGEEDSSGEKMEPVVEEQLLASEPEVRPPRPGLQMVCWVGAMVLVGLLVYLLV